MENGEHLLGGQTLLSTPVGEPGQAVRASPPPTGAPPAAPRLVWTRVMFTLPGNTFENGRYNE